ISQKLVDEYPDVPRYQSDLANSLHTVAFVLHDRGQLLEARAHMERAIKLQQAALDAVEGRNARFRQLLWTHNWGLAQILIGLKDHAGASQAIENMPRIDPDSWEACYRAVPLIASCAILADQDDKIPQAERKRLFQARTGRIMELLAE